MPIVLAKYFIAISVFLIGAPLLVLTIRAVFIGIMNNYKVVDIRGNQQTPTPTTFQTPTPTQKVVVSKKNNQPKEEEIWCTGPDYKTFLATQVECDKFNAAWGKKTYQAPQQTSKPTSSTSNLTFHCYENTYKYWYYTTSGEQCNADNSKSTSYKICESIQVIKLDSCKYECKKQGDEDDAMCAWAYTGSNPGVELSYDRYGDCLNGSDGAGVKYAECLTKCSNQLVTDLKTCL